MKWHQVLALKTAKARGDETGLPELLMGLFGVILACRGSLSTQSSAQMEKFQAIHSQPGRAEISALGFSTNDEDYGNEMLEVNDATFPIVFGLDREQVGSLIQGYVNRGRRSLECLVLLI